MFLQFPSPLMLAEHLSKWNKMATQQDLPVIITPNKHQFELLFIHGTSFTGAKELRIGIIVHDFSKIRDNVLKKAGRKDLPVSPLPHVLVVLCGEVCHLSG
jgi:hypothetical protein